MNMMSNLSEGRVSPLWKQAAVILAMAAMLIVAGCSTDNTAEQEEAEYPNVNAVPDKPETVASLTEAQEIGEGLRGDREQARYTDETLRADTSVQPPLPPKAKPVAAVKDVKAPVAETARTAPEKPVAAAAPQAPEPVRETPLAAPAPEPVPAESMAPKSATEKTIAAAAPTPDTMAPKETDSSEKDGINRVFEERLNASAATRLPEGMKSGTADAAPPRSAAPAPSAVPAVRTAPAPTETPPVVISSPDGGRLIRNYAASDGTAPIEILYFAQGSHRLSAADTEILTRIARFQTKAGGKLRVVGHASSQTRAMPETRHMIVNLNVSQARASAVAEFLLKEGVQPGDLILESVSDAKPQIAEPTQTAEAKNRRAEIFLLN